MVNIKIESPYELGNKYDQNSLNHHCWTSRQQFVKHVDARIRFTLAKITNPLADLIKLGPINYTLEQTIQFANWYGTLIGVTPEHITRAIAIGERLAYIRFQHAQEKIAGKVTILEAYVIAKAWEANRADGKQYALELESAEEEKARIERETRQARLMADARARGAAEQLDRLNRERHALLTRSTKIVDRSEWLTKKIKGYQDELNQLKHESIEVLRAIDRVDSESKMLKGEHESQSDAESAQLAAQASADDGIELDPSLPVVSNVEWQVIRVEQDYEWLTARD